MAMLDLGEEIKPRPARHRQVKYDRVKRLLERGECSLPVIRLRYKNARKVIIEDRTDSLSYDHVIIDEQNPLHCRSF